MIMKYNMTEHQDDIKGLQTDQEITMTENTMTAKEWNNLLFMEILKKDTKEVEITNVKA